MATEWQLRQAAIDALYGMLRSSRPKKFSGAKADVALNVLQEMREAKEDCEPAEWVQQLAAETAVELALEKRNRH